MTHAVWGTELTAAASQQRRVAVFRRRPCYQRLSGLRIHVSDERLRQVADGAR